MFSIRFDIYGLCTEPQHNCFLTLVQLGHILCPQTYSHGLKFTVIDMKLGDGAIFPVMCQLCFVSVHCPLKGCCHLCSDRRLL